MTIINLAQVRSDRAAHKVSLEADAKRIIDVSTQYGQQLAGDAVAITRRLGHADREIDRAIEMLTIRRGLRQSRALWVAEYGRVEGNGFAKMAGPIVRVAYWTRLDELQPITTTVNGIAVPLIRGWRDVQRLREGAA